MIAGGRLLRHIVGNRQISTTPVKPALHPYLAHIRYQLDNHRELDDVNPQNQLWVHRGLAYRIIGTKGETIQNIKRQSGALVRVDTDNVENGKVCINLEGTSKACADAKRMIEDKIAETTIWVPKKMARRIIGEGGKMVQDIKTQSGAIVNLYDDDESDEVCVSIEGPPKKCADAKRMVEEILNESTTIWAPVTHIGMIIGRRGAIVNAIKKDTNVDEIDIHSASVKYGLVPVIIKGPAKERAAAVEEINKIINRP